MNKLFYISLFSLFTIGLFAQKGDPVFCNVQSVTFHHVSECDSTNNAYYIPVTVEYFTSVSAVIGEPPAVDTIRVRTDSSKYNFHNTYFLQDHVTNNPINAFNFLLYGQSTGLLDTALVTIDLIGTCALFTKQYEYIFTSPDVCNVVTPVCPENLALTETEMDSVLHKAANTINSIQTIESGADVTYKAGQSITLGVGFHAKAGSEALLKIEACIEN